MDSPTDEHEVHPAGGDDALTPGEPHTPAQQPRSGALEAELGMLEAMLPPVAPPRPALPPKPAAPLDHPLEDVEDLDEEPGAPDPAGGSLS